MVEHHTITSWENAHLLIDVELPQALLQLDQRPRELAWAAGTREMKQPTICMKITNGDV